MNFFRWLLGARPVEHAWVKLGSGGDVEYAEIRRLGGGVVLAKVYGNWKVVGESYVKEILGDHKAP